MEDTDLKKTIRKTGTATVGIVCKEGLILAADKRGIADVFIAQKTVKKIHKITDNIVVTIAGNVSDIQLVLKLIKAELRLKAIRTKRMPSVKEAANLFASIVYQNIRKFSPILAITSFIVGGKDSLGFGLYEVSPDGTISEFKNYVTTGAYGSFIAYGILENEWRPDLPIEEGREMAIKIIKTAIKRDASVGEGIDVVAIDKIGVGEIKEIKLEEVKFVAEKEKAKEKPKGKK